MSPKGLCARFRQKQSEPSSSVELGASSANAYFTSKRIRQRVPRKAKPAPRDERLAVVTRTPSDEQDHQIDPETGRKLRPKEEIEGQIKALQLPLQDELIAELRATDELVVGTTLNQCYEQCFPMWKSEVLAGYNLLFYGVGSKLSLLQVRSCYISLDMDDKTKERGAFSIRFCRSLRPRISVTASSCRYMAICRLSR